MTDLRSENERRAREVADEMAAQMAAALKHHTPEELGWQGLTPEELIESEWRCWFDEEMRKAERRSCGKGRRT